VDVGIAEEHALIFANTLALSYKKPFVSIYSTFLQRGYDELIHDIAKINKNVVIGIDRCGIIGEDGASHQGIYDISFMLPIPNLIIMAPKDSVEASNILYSSFKYEHPVAIRYSKNSIDYKEENFKYIYPGTWEVLNFGENATIISYGDFLNTSISISEKLLKDNINVEVVNARSIKPIDEKLFKRILSKNEPIFIYEEATKIGSLGSYLLIESQKCDYNNKIYIIGIEDEFIPHGDKKEVLKYLKLDENSVYNYIKKILSK
jgi:1-deoxy-D-xylulose-5-phosphate synthase